MLNILQDTGRARARTHTPLAMKMYAAQGVHGAAVEKPCSGWGVWLWLGHVSWRGTSRYQEAVFQVRGAEGSEEAPTYSSRLGGERAGKMDSREQRGRPGKKFQPEVSSVGVREKSRIINCNGDVGEKCLF